MQLVAVDIGHLIQERLVCLKAGVSGHRVVGLLRSHLVVVSALQMGEAAAGTVVAVQRVQRGLAVRGKLAVRGGVPVQCAQHDNDLGVGLAAVTKASVGVLPAGQPGQRLVHRRFGGIAAVIVGSQRLHGHGGHVDVRIRLRVADIPGAAFHLDVGDLVDQRFTGHVAVGGIVVAVQRQQCPNGAAGTLLADVAHAVQALHQIIAAHAGGILADSRQRQDHTGIVGGLVAIQPVLAVDVLLNIRHHVLVIGVRIGHIAAAAGQTQHQPFAAGKVHSRRRVLGLGSQKVAGELIDGLVDATQRQVADVGQVIAAAGSIILFELQRQRPGAGGQRGGVGALLSAAEIADSGHVLRSVAENGVEHVIACLRGHAVVEGEQQILVHGEGEGGLGGRLVLIYVGALEAVLLGVVLPGIAAVGHVGGGNALFRQDHIGQPLIVPLLDKRIAAVTGIGVIGRIAGHLVVAGGVAQSRHGVRLGLAAALALTGAGNAARFRAGGRYGCAVAAGLIHRRVIAPVMAQRVHIGVLVALVAAGAGMGGIALFRAGGGGDGFVVRLVETHTLLPRQGGITAAADGGKLIAQLRICSQGLGVFIVGFQGVALASLHRRGIHAAKGGVVAGGVAGSDGHGRLHCAGHPMRFALRRAANAAGVAAGDGAGVIAAVNGHTVAAAAEDAARIAAGGGHRTGVVAAGDGGAVSSKAADDAAHIAAAGDIAVIGAVADGGVLASLANNAAHVAGGSVDSHIAEAILNHNAAICVARNSAAAGGSALQGQIADMGIAADLAEQALLGVQADDLIALAVQHGLLIGRHIQPGVLGQVDIGSQHTGDILILALSHEPRQLRAGADLIDAVIVLLRLGGGNAIPCIGRGGGQGDLEGVRALRGKGDGTGGVFKARAGDGVIIHSGRCLEGGVLFDNRGVAAAVLHGDSQLVAGNGLAIIVLKGQRTGEEIAALAHRDCHLRQAGQVVADLVARISAFSLVILHRALCTGTRAI